MVTTWSAKFSQCRSKSVEIWPEHGHILRARPILVECGPPLVSFRTKLWPNIGEYGPSLSQSGPDLADSDQNWAHIHQFWPKLGPRCRKAAPAAPSSGQLRLPRLLGQLRPTLVDAGPVLVKLGQLRCTRIRRCWAKFDQLLPSLDLAHARPQVVELVQIWT